MKYNKVILKLSGEILSGSDSFGFDYQKINEIIQEIKSIHSTETKIGIVIGAGNIFRARMIKNNEISRVDGDQMGMMATILNAICLKNVLNSQNIKTRVL
ncbi:UMP kinase, partial [bacterium]|nr:UMP kinase [bacterium]